MTEASYRENPKFNPQWFAEHAGTAADAIRDYLAGALKDLMDQFHDRARKDELNDNAGRSPELREALMQLRSHNEILSNNFLAEIRRKFDPDAEQRAMQATMTISFEELSLQNPESLDESIAITNVGNRSELLYEHQLWEIRQRMEWWRDEKYPRVSDKSVAPYAICRAFFEAMRNTDIDSQHRLPLCWQFDRYVLRHLHEVYENLIKIFDKFGFLPLRPNAQITDRSTRPDVAPTSAVQDATGETEASQSSTTAESSKQGLQQNIDPQTWQMLSQFGQVADTPTSTGNDAGASTTPPSQASASYSSGQSSAASSANPDNNLAPPVSSHYSDQHLAQELTALLSGHQVPGWNPELAQEMQSRISVVGRAFNQMLADPSLTRTVKPQFDSLRFSILKTALSDESFFRNASHPMRALLSELAGLATSSRLYTPEEIHRLGEMLTQLHQKHAASAEAVRTSQQQQNPISATDLDAFLDELRDDQKARRAALIEKSRRVVSEELWLQTAARRCTDALRQTLEASWEPMMALRLLRYGVDSKLWNRGINILRRIVDKADPQPESDNRTETKQSLLDEFAQELKSVGMLDERVSGLIEALSTELDRSQEHITDAVQDDNPIVSPESTNELLEAILTPDSWFEVFDHDQDIVSWLQAVGLNDDGSQVRFSEFHGENEIQIPVEIFLGDLRKGISAAVNPTPRARAALAKLTDQ